MRQFFNVTDKTEKIVFTSFISKFAKKDKLRICFEEICYTNKITEQDVKWYLGLLQDRINDIEETIDNHIELVRSELVNLKREQLFRKLKKEQTEKDKKNKSKQQKLELSSAKSQRGDDDNSVDQLAAQYQDQLEIIEEKLKKDPSLKFDEFSF